MSNIFTRLNWFKRTIVQMNNSSNGSGSNEIASPKSVKILSLLFANDTTYQLSGNNLNDQRIYSLKKLLNGLRQTNLP